MEANGCPWKKRKCEWPKDKHADIEPILVMDLGGKFEMRYYISYDGSFRQAPLDVRARTICSGCAAHANAYLSDLIEEDKRKETAWAA